MKENKLKRDLQLIISSSTYRLLMMFSKFIVSLKRQSNKYKLTFEIQISLAYNLLVCNKIMDMTIVIWIGPLKASGEAR